MPILQQPEAYIGQAANLFEDDGNLKDKDTEAFFKNFIDTFAGWIERTQD